jgi:FlaA1/EpsC-like NDP-sugar epimerase
MHPISPSDGAYQPFLIEIAAMLSTCSETTFRLLSRLASINRLVKILMMVSADLIALPLCFMVAMLLRVGSVDFMLRYGLAPNILISLITVPVFAMTGLYGAVLRFIDHCLLTAAGIGLALVVALTFLLSSFFNYKSLPHSALMIYGFVAFAYVVSSRLVLRRLLRQVHGGRAETRLVAIYGAGEAGAKLAIAMRVSGAYRVACFFDDNPALSGRSVAGLKVLPPERCAPVVRERGIGLIVIAAPSATASQRRDMMARVQRARIPVKILGSLVELADEEISTQSIREIKIDDLLGREPIRPRPELFAKCVQGKNILVTGAGGSIGSELCRQIMTQSPRQLHLLDHSEYALYRIERELRGQFPGASIQPHLGSVCDAALVERVMGECRIETVYHAAAYKHVPLVEDNMAEGVRNNVLGADVVASAAAKFQVRTCVLVSTDKAVRPTSIMGASKRIAELVFQAAAERVRASGAQGACTRFCMVRFGNVLGSSGSVVPLFENQIRRGGPITVTHPDVVRYFMSIPEAAQLVVQAGAMACGGDVFVMDMGDPVRIVDLARAMIAMCGLSEKTRANPGGDIAIETIGLRPGEKLYEEMFAGDDAIPSKHPRIMTTTEYVIEPDVLAQQVAYLMVACATNDKAMIRFIVQKLVRGYVPKVEAEATMEALAQPRGSGLKRNFLHLVNRSV